METTSEITWEEILRKAGPYPLEAFNFVREGLNFTAEQVHSAQAALGEAERHISGQQLCIGLRDYAIDQYGLLAPVVLEHWHIRRTDDFGRIVFAMINAGLMSKTDEDTIDDFRSVYDFREVFSRDQVLQRISRN